MIIDKIFRGKVYTIRVVLKEVNVRNNNKTIKAYARIIKYGSTRA